MISDSLLKTLFLEQMSENVKLILDSNRGNLVDFPKHDDSIMEHLSPLILAVVKSDPIATFYQISRFGAVN